MSDICDNTSVGMIVKRNEKILLIERKKFPYGFAAPAGHLDGDSYEEGAKRELKEETGLDSLEIKLVAEGRKENHCRRRDGTWHYWKIYEVTTGGEIHRSKEETKKAGWYSNKEIRKLADRTEEYIREKIPEEEWQKSPGLEPVWYEWMKELNII